MGPGLRFLASGGARLDPEMAWRLEGLGWEVLTGYGLTETAPILTFNPPGRARMKAGGNPSRASSCASRPQPRTPSPGQGEIQARGPNVFAGYLENPEATAEVSPRTDFFRTGDLGYLDDEATCSSSGAARS